MPVTLSDAEVCRLRDFSARLLTVVDAEDADAWAASVLELVGPVFGADRAFLLMPDGDGVRFGRTDADMERAQRAYLSYYAPHDIYITRRRRQLGIHSFVHRQLIRPDEERTSVLWNEYLIDNALYDPAGITFDHDGVPDVVGLCLYHERSESAGFDTATLTKLQLVEPVVGAALRLSGALRGQRKVLLQNVDRLTSAALLLDLKGSVVHANRAFCALGVDRHKEQTVLDAAGDLVRRLVDGTRPLAAAAAPPVPQLEVSVIVPPHTFRLRALELTTGFGLRTRHFLVDVREERGQRYLTAEALIGRFGLTPRQAEVALKLAERCSNQEIAAALGISSHTARHHTEMVMAKLGATSRAEVRSKVISGAAPGHKPAN